MGKSKKDVKVGSQKVPVVGETVEEVGLKAIATTDIKAGSVADVNIDAITGSTTIEAAEALNEGNLEKMEEEIDASVVQTAHDMVANPLDETIPVNKYLFCKMFATCVKGSGYTSHAAVTRFGAMLGATTHEEQVKAWQDVQRYLAEVK